MPRAISSAPYCGDMPMRRAALVTRDAQGGVPALFAGRRVSYCHATRVAIRRACDLLGLVPGDEVLAPAYHCGSELDPLLHAGLQVRLYAVGADTVIDPALVAAAITPRTKAVYLIHYFGFLQPATAALRALCDARGLRLIEDCALNLLSGAHPAEGRAGDVALFCFYKFFPTHGGGALVLNADSLTGDTRFTKRVPLRMAAKPLLRAGVDLALGAERRVALLRRLKPARVAPVAAPDADMPADYYFDARLQDTAMSALTARQIAAFDTAEAIALRRRNYRLYQAELATISHLHPLFPDLPAEICPLVMPVITDARDALAAALVQQGIAATPWWAGYHRSLDFSGQTTARFLKDHVLALPCHQYLAPAAIRHICQVLRDLMAGETGSDTRDLAGNRL